jgi:hypothetical protein
MVTKKVSAQERKLQVQLKEANEKYSALQAEYEGLWADFEKAQEFSSERVGEVTALKEKYEPKIPQQKRTNFERAIRQRIAENLSDTNKLPWLVGTGVEAASAKIDCVVDLLSSKLNGDEAVLTKTLRVARNAVLCIYDGVQHRECSVMLQCPCTRGVRQHHRWPSYTAGCFSQGSDSGSRIGAGLWDTAEFLRLHHGYETPKLVAQTTIMALQQLAKELRSREEDLTWLVEKIRKETAANPQPVIAKVSHVESEFSETQL